MKSKIINGKVKILVTDGIPDKASEIYKKWEMLGHYKELSEEQWKGIVEDSQVYDPNGHPYEPITAYKDYLSGNWVVTATESGLSMIESEVLLRNPYEKPRIDNYRDNGRWIYEFADADYENELSNWQAAEDQVFHNPILFVEFKK